MIEQLQFYKKKYKKKLLEKLNVNFCHFKNVKFSAIRSKVMSFFYAKYELYCINPLATAIFKTERFFRAPLSLCTVEGRVFLPPLDGSSFNPYRCLAAPKG